MIRVELPGHLRALAHVKGEVTVEVAGTVSVLSVLDAVETQYPMLRGTIRDHVTQQRRPFFAIFCVRRGFVARASGDAVTRSGGERKRTATGGGSDRGRLAFQLLT